MKPPINVLVAEESPTVYQFLNNILSSQADIKVVGWALNGKQVVQQTAALRPDLVLMDLHMPVLDGLQATTAIMSHNPTPILMVTTTDDPHDVALSLEALRSGALALVEKPTGPNHIDSTKKTKHLLYMIRALAEVKTVKLRIKTRLAPESNRFATNHLKLITIAASTGGPQALSLILSALRRHFPLPILLVQHIGGEFTEGFVSWLQSCTGLKVVMARHGEAVRAGHLYVAGYDRHLEIDSSGLLIEGHSPPRGGFRPSADNLFMSAGHAYGNQAAAIILTGMGDDGTRGLELMHERGCFVIAQDKASSVVYGMPKAAKEAGVVSDVLSLQEIAAWLLHMQDAYSINTILDAD